MRLKPFFLALTAIGLFSVMNALIKGLSFHYETFEVAFMRYIAGGIVIFAVICWTKPGWPSLDTVESNVLRGLLGLTTGVSFFFALKLQPLADAIALSFLAPLFVAVFSILLLGERPKWQDFAALALGFAGMLVMVSTKTGGAERSIWGPVASILSAIAYGLSITLLRQRAQRDPHTLIVFFQNWIPALFVAPAAGAVWVTPAPQHILIAGALGLLGVAAHMCMVKAYSLAQASKLAPMEYSALIYAAIIGMAFFNEKPEITTLAGSVLIIIGAFIASRR